ncbi:MAG: hypothetical protein ACXAE3_16605, partial [Candidatus Kariarchaeaceae archaeon]
MPATLGENPFDLEEDLASDLTLGERLLGALTFDRRVLVVVPYEKENTTLAIITIILASFLDYSNLSSFNLRFNLLSGGELTIFHPIIQLIVIFYASWLIRKAVQLMGNDVTTLQVFRLIGLSVIWTILGWLLLVFFSLFPPVFSILAFSTYLLVFFGYFMVLIIGLTSARTFGDYATALLFMALYLIIGLL